MADDMLNKAVEEKTLKELLKDFPERVVALLGKLVSFKGVVLGLSTWLVLTERIETYAWLIVIVLVLFGREGLKFIQEIKK